ncbi:MAG: DUF5050 domain-containing protein [Eubacteriales bacterium]|nr:DUF5050 domain-containing protein [Eubacteriales bacterium]
MKKKLFVFIAIITAAALMFSGCSLMENLVGTDSEEEVYINGTTTGNILNYGFAVRYGDALIFLYTGQGTYDYGSVVRSNPDTGESSLVLEQGGLYMSVVDGCLYYCRPDGVYKAPLDTGEPALVLAQNVSLLQIQDAKMYFIRDGNIGCAGLDGEAADFSEIENAGCLNVYGGAIYYIDTGSGYICKADMDGGNKETVYDQSVEMFYVIEDVIYFIDSADGYIKRMTLALESLETVVADACSGFNVNGQGLYYTRDVDGQSLCCNAGADGYQETVITDFGESAWHIACMFGEGAVVIREEDLSGLE